ncbi:Uncharacterised protein [Candidatus Burarchaeum australiense]|nr:Uncharacterised protein [Candidatus Burarchaeum australiense]
MSPDLRPVRVMFVDEKLHLAYEALKAGRFEERELAENLGKAIEALKQNRLRSIKLPRQLWPDDYVRKYGITVLYKHDMPRGWRLLYTEVGDRVEIVSILLEWLDHESYEKRFGYKKK